eukprot:3653729-Amphidinium_carterae.1
MNAAQGGIPGEGGPAVQAALQEEVQGRLPPTFRLFPPPAYEEESCQDMHKDDANARQWEDHVRQ